jgi:predicted nucleic acid-binding protein
VTVLIDTSFLVALAVGSDSNHAAALKLVPTLQGERVLPIPVMPESFYMVSVRLHYRAAVKLYTYMQPANFKIEPLTVSDRLRMGEIMTQYLDAEFDFVDLALMTIAERLNITQVCTFDRRDFSIFRPKHSSHLEILPSP